MLNESPHYNSEKDLVTSLQEGRKEALAFLYDAYAPFLLGAITRIVSDKDLSEEVLRESFVEIWNQIGSFDPAKGSLAFCMLSVTRAVALEAYRTGRRKPPSLSGGPSEPVTGQAQPSEAWRDGGGIEGPVTPSGPGERGVFDLVFWKGYSCAEAAEELGVSTETVKTTFRAAVKELRAGSEE